jgi:DNA polymerase-3 subunit alpha
MVKNVTAHSYDFYLDDETNKCTVNDGADVVIGGMITSKTIKFTKKNQAMAFITLEDLFGSVEVIIFPRDYEKNKHLIEEDNRVFIKGRVQADEDKDAKLICSRMVSFNDVPLDIWIRFKNREEYELSVDELEAIPYDSHGRERLVIYLEEEKNRKIMPHFYSISNNSDVMNRLVEKHGQKNVIVVEKQIEFGRERV